MKNRHIGLLVLGFILVSASGWHDARTQECEQESLDRGECDTLSVVCLDCYKEEGQSGAWSVRFPLLVSHDQTQASDSIAGFTIPLTYTHTYSSAYCSVTSYWNATSMGWYAPDFGRSIYRHMVEDGDTLYHNRMALLEGDFSMRGWDMTILTLDDTSNFWLAIVPTGSADQRWWEGNRILLAAMTLRIADTMHVCIDTTFWPPASRLAFARSDGALYIPRHDLPRCFWVGPPRIQVVSPSGGETWPVGSSQDITWLSENFEGPQVRIECSTNSGSDWETVADSTPNTRSYLWTIPDTPSDSCRLKISDASDGFPQDESDADFAIVEPDFAIEIEPDTQVVEAGESVDYSVILTSLYGFDSPCTLSVSGLPSFTSASFEPNPCAPTDTSVLTISTQGLTPAGTYTLLVTATKVGEEQTQHSTGAVLVVNAGGLPFEEAEVGSEFMEGGASEGEHCPKCVVNWCRTTYPTYGDEDGDGMNDDYEMELARQFKPILYYDDASSEISYCMPHHYNEPPYSHESGPNHGLPDDIVSDGTVYVHVRPFFVLEPGVAYFIEIAYWFYYSYSQAECHSGYVAEHGHDWEHVGLCLAKPPEQETLQVVRCFFAQHFSGEYHDVEELYWTGTPGLSSLKVFVVNGSHASYASTGRRCTYRDPIFNICWCYENANGNHPVVIDDSKIVNLHELGDPRSPGWLTYSSTWPGFSLNMDTPHGPAWGNHANWWISGHFGDPPACIEVWRQDVPTPMNFQISTFQHGQALMNALHLSWDGPLGWDGFNLRRCLVPVLPNSDDPSCECIAQLGPTVLSYLDTCLDGGRTYYYELKTFHDHPEAEYRGCSWPALGQGTPSGGLCSPDMSPSPPTVTSCESCTLRWEDNSWNEVGFIIDLYGEVCDSVGRNCQTFPVRNCCTGNKRSYHVTAFNEYGENRSVLGMYCNNPPGCQPTLGCDGGIPQVPLLGPCSEAVLVSLVVCTAAFFIVRRLRGDSRYKTGGVRR
jgi:hypothetical protein